MYHINRLTRLLSYFNALLLIIYFVIYGFNLSDSHLLLYISSIWFCGYGIFLSSAKKTIAYYKIFVVANVITTLAGYGLCFFLSSEAGFMILSVSISMLAFIITMSRR